MNEYVQREWCKIKFGKTVHSCHAKELNSNPMDNQELQELILIFSSRKCKFRNQKRIKTQER